MRLIIKISIFASFSGTIAAQDATVRFLPQPDLEGYELIEYSMVPEGDEISEEDKLHQIRFRFFSKPLPGIWLNEYTNESLDNPQSLAEEEEFVSLVLNTYRNLTTLDELESILDPGSFTKRQEQYASDESYAFFEDSTRYSTWEDVRLIALARYANYHLILCDVKQTDVAEGENEEIEYRLEAIHAVYLENGYRLTEIANPTYGLDLLVNSFFVEGSYNGEIWQALRSRAGTSQ